ncbi:MAG: hypothetical protein LBR22_00180 [Desulfovibrio sp.]|nr:hypothetical protein [Desulfovibrio sp.]
MKLNVLWDGVDIWGAMMLRALTAHNLPFSLAKCAELADGEPLGKQGISVLLVPGGSAARKAAALGAAGREAIVRFVEEGGVYMGFCGGAGLALTHEDPAQGLGLCPWRRAPYPARFQHLVSGHVLAECPAKGHLSPKAEGLRLRTHFPRGDGSKGSSSPREDGLIPLPVWWPGRFAPEEGGDVEVLATCRGPGDDFWVADLPLSDVPKNVFEDWRARHGVDVSASFLEGQPLVIHGRRGKGRYLLSYSHLETPESPDANVWFTGLLQKFEALPRSYSAIFKVTWDWRLDEPYVEDSPLSEVLHDAIGRSLDLLELGENQGVLFPRTPWLWGWRGGVPGAACNNVHAALCLAAALRPSSAYGVSGRHGTWKAQEQPLEELVNRYFDEAEKYFMSAKLAATLNRTLPEAVDEGALTVQREDVFGQPMQGGGLADELLGRLDGLICTARLHTGPWDTSDRW